MEIKRQVKLSFLAIVILVIIISSINLLVFIQVKANNTIKADIGELISLQENMNGTLKDVKNSENMKELNIVKKLFATYEKQFEQLKKRTENYSSQNILYSFSEDIHQDKIFKKSLKMLIHNEKNIEVAFDKIFVLQQKAIETLKDIKDSYQNENRTRKLIEKKIDAVKDLFLTKKLGKMAYHSKETLFQHKDKKTLDKWLANIDTIQAKYPLKLLVKYRKIAIELGGDIIRLQNIYRKIGKLGKEIEIVLDKNEKVDVKILDQLDMISKKFTTFIYIVMTTLIFLTIALIIIISYKVNKNVGLSVDEINQKVHEGLREIESLNHEIEETQKEVVFTMGAIGESRSKETGNHVKRVAHYSKILALHYGLGEKEADILKQASPMHDIGKVAIADSILNKNGKLNDKERKIMDTHTKLGYDMLKHSSRDLLKAAATVAYEHHEKYDGSGYPRGLSGENIHIYGRITAVADVFDALGSDRCYKKAWDDERIFELFKEQRGKHFDPKLVDIFFKHLDEFLGIRDTFKDV